MVVFALSWPIAAIPIAGIACVAVVLWSLFRGSPGGGAVGAAAIDRLSQDVSSSQASLSRDLNSLRDEVAELRSQVAEVLRVLKDVG